MIENPWKGLPDSRPYVLPEDASAIERFNARASALWRIELDAIPEPFLGRPEAPVVLLNLNPGFSEDDLTWHEEPTFKEQSLRNLTHRSEWLFYLLDPSLNAPGCIWWRKRLRRLIEATSLEAVSNGVLCVELFPYHSCRFAHSRLGLPSQEYGYALVREAMKRNAIVVSLRGWRPWLEAVPELEGYGTCFRLRNVQNVTLTAGNCPEGFDLIVEAIRQG
ncbi:MAG: hypothetical protein LC667_21125 [Thioalkalivibrio sp.]|nr:hypothetical protein [Thioalkalivibrio sp.]